MEKFAVRLKDLRIEKDLSQRELASAIGMSQTAITQWEMEKRIPNAQAIIILANFFQVTAGYLLGIED